MLNETDLSRADLNLLVLFEAVFAERHVGRAAERLSLSPSAVSHGLGRMRRLFNDPLFLRTPRGVVPTDRAAALAPGIADALHQVRAVIGAAAPFDPRSSIRRLVIGAPDGVAAVFLPPLLEQIAREAPGVGLGVRALLPLPDETSLGRAWRGALAELEARALDVAIVPTDDVPARFDKRLLCQEDFVLAMRPEHAFLKARDVAAYCAARHLVVSASGDPHGFVDEVLARQGLARQVALTLPNFLFACTVLADSDLICALPRSLAASHADRLGFTYVDAPLPLGESGLHAVVPKLALGDAGIVWLLDRLAAAVGA